MEKLIILDLDGTLTPQRPSSVAPFKRELLPGVRAKCAKLVAAGNVLAVASNQGGLRKGLEEWRVHAILEWVVSELGIDGGSEFASGFVPYRKKPRPGMLVDLMHRNRVSPADTLFVGDAETDEQAAQAAGISFRWADEFFKTQSR